MADVVDRATRSRIMAAIKGRDTGPEMLVRRFLHGRGLRYRLHDRRLPGRPDLVLPGLRTVVFVSGCFWHRHEGCPRTTMPKSNVGFWEEKFRRNVERDVRNQAALRDMGWRVIVIWGCETTPEGLERLLRQVQGLEPVPAADGREKLADPRSPVEE
ncbi:MAG: DNA mismatch endonuclease Vsr [Desulfovibrio sp.]|jgi:DNA mismatch endonuclease (patch repair protein)|nr:DNA mismatch endonuclease Vsr [Desulfovibrio sp.]